jgi:hypothetical protein
MGFVVLALGLAAFSALDAFAHKPSMLLVDNADGTFSVAVAGLHDTAIIKLESETNGEILWNVRTDEDGKATCPKFDRPYTVVVEAGKGHPLKHPGPSLEKACSDTKARRQALNHKAEPPVREGALKHKAGHQHGHHPEYPEWSPPMAGSVDAEMRYLLQPLWISIRNELDLVRRTHITQCYRYHAQPHMGEVLHLAEAEKAKGKRVKLVTGDVGLCFGVTSAFLATDFAIRKLYSNGIPEVGDFSITSKAQMGGIWDALELLFGQKLSRDEAVKSHTPEALVFIASRRSTGRHIAFGYAEKYHGRIARFFDAKIYHPGNYPAGEFRRIKNQLIRELLKRHSAGDYGYFTVIQDNSKKEVSLKQ